MIDNYNEIRKYLNFDSDTFYYLQVLQRKKDNPEQSWISRQKYSRLIKSLDDFDSTYEISIKIADLYNARVYIDISPGSLEKLTTLSLKELSNRVYNKAYQNIFRLFDNLAPSDETRVKDKKKWMIDVDYQEGTDEFQRVENYLISNSYISIIGKIKTFNGMHIIISPFNYKGAFIDLYEIDKDRNYELPTGETFGVKLHCNTLLYYGK